MEVRRCYDCVSIFFRIYPELELGVWKGDVGVEGEDRAMVDLVIMKDNG